MANCDRHNLTHPHTQQCKESMNICMCLNRLVLHYIDMKYESTHSIYPPIQILIIHSYRFLHANMVRHTHTNTHINHTCPYKTWTEYFNPGLQTQLVLKKVPNDVFNVQAEWNQTTVKVNLCLCLTDLNMLFS